MKRLAEYKAKTLAVSDVHKNPSRDDIMKKKPLYCTPENPNEHSPEELLSVNVNVDVNETAKEGMENIFKHYLAHNPSVRVVGKTPELEIRFRGLGGAPLSKIDYDSVIQHLYAAGFNSENPNGNHILRISPEYVDDIKGIKKLSNIRTEIVGIDLIQEYCKTNSIQHLLNLPSTLSASMNKNGCVPVMMKF
jgi:hypothetical protein